MSALPVSLEDKYTLDSGRVYLTGTQALVRLPMIQRERDLAAGFNTAGFISGYRGSPLGGFDQALWKAKTHLEKHHIHFQPGVKKNWLLRPFGVRSKWGYSREPSTTGCLPCGTARVLAWIAVATCLSTPMRRELHDLAGCCSSQVMTTRASLRQCRIKVNTPSMRQ